jgi:hypothetical protein
LFVRACVCMCVCVHMCVPDNWGSVEYVCGCDAV